MNLFFAWVYIWVLKNDATEIEGVFGFLVGMCIPCSASYSCHPKSFPLKAPSQLADKELVLTQFKGGLWGPLFEWDPLMVRLPILLGCPWKLVTFVSKLVYNLLRGRIQPTYKGVIIFHLLSTMDIQVFPYL